MMHNVLPTESLQCQPEDESLLHRMLKVTLAAVHRPTQEVICHPAAVSVSQRKPASRRLAEICLCLVQLTLS